MRLIAILRNRWVWVPSALVVLILFAATAFLMYLLGTRTPAMYLERSPFKTQTSEQAATELVVYTSLRPSNWDVYLFEPNEYERRLNMSAPGA